MQSLLESMVNRDRRQRVMIESMADDVNLEDAIKLATERTKAAQTKVDDVIQDDEVPPARRVELVVERADDLDQLAQDGSGDSDTRPARGRRS